MNQKKVLPVLFWIMNSTSVMAQAPSVQWAKVYGGNDYDASRSILEKNGGGYIVVGESASYMNQDVSGGWDSTDVWICSLSSGGTLQWETSVGGNRYDRGSSVAKTSDGGFIVGGTTLSNDGDVSGNNGALDYWVVKFDVGGNIQWQKCLGGSKNEYAQSIIQTTDGGYMVAGDSYSNDGNVTGHFGCAGSSDYWAVKLNSSGTIQWDKSYGGQNYDYCSVVKQTPDGGYIFSGRTESFDGQVTGFKGEYDIWVVKTDASGNLQWQKTYGGAMWDWGQSIALTSDGGYVLGDYVYSVDGDITVNQGDYDYWIVKINSSGGIQWQKTVGGLVDDFANSIIQTTDGGYVISGGSTSSNGDITNPLGDFDYWVAKVNSSGALLWQKSLGGSDYEISLQVIQTSDGGYAVTGESISTDGNCVGNRGNYDFFIVKLF